MASLQVRCFFSQGGYHFSPGELLVKPRSDATIPQDFLTSCSGNATNFGVDGWMDEWIDGPLDREINIGNGNSGKTQGGPGK